MMSCSFVHIKAGRGAKHAIRHHKGDGRSVLDQVMHMLASHRVYMSLTVYDPVSSVD